VNYSNIWIAKEFVLIVRMHYPHANIADTQMFLLNIFLIFLIQQILQISLQLPIPKSNAWNVKTGMELMKIENAFLVFPILIQIV